MAHNIAPVSEVRIARESVGEEKTRTQITKF